MCGGQSAGEEEEEESADDPKCCGVGAGDPMLFACESVGVGDDAFHDGGFDGGAEFPLLYGECALFGGDICAGVVVHAAGFDDGEHLAGGVKVEGEVVGVVDADGDAKGEDEDEGCDPPGAGGK